MEKETLLKEYKATLESLVKKTRFCYSEKFYKLGEFEKQKYQKDKMTTEAHLSTLCNLLWGDNLPTPSGGLGELFALGIISSMFNYGGGFGNTFQNSMQKYNEKEFVIPETTENKAVN